VNVEIQIGSTKYRVVFRHIIRCEIRTRQKFSQQIAVAEAQCHEPMDKFDERTGKVLAFRRCFEQIKWNVATKEGRRAIWKRFFDLLDPRPKSKKPAKVQAPKAEAVPVMTEAAEVARQAHEVMEEALRTL
jgi:hypothetical protein